MSAPTMAVRWVLARAAVRATGALHVVSERDTGALNPVCGANPIRSTTVERFSALDDGALLCPACALLAASLAGQAGLPGGTAAGVAVLLARPAAVEGVQLLELEPCAVVVPADHPVRGTLEELGALTASVQEVGLLQPIVLRRTASGHELVAGARRLAAARAAGLPTVPALVRDLTDEQAVLATLTENLHRADLNPIEAALAYQEALAALGGTVEALAERLHVSRPQVSNTIRLLALPEQLRSQVADGRLSAAHGRALLRVRDEAARNALAGRIAADGLTSRQADAAARRLTAAARPADARLGDVARLLTDLLDTRVLVAAGAKADRITIEVPHADLPRVLEQLGIRPAVAA